MSGLSSFGQQSVVAVLVGLTEVLGRFTFAYRDRLSRVLVLLLCRRRDALNADSADAYRQPRRMEFLTDYLISSMIAEWTAIVGGNVFRLQVLSLLLNTRVTSLP